MDQTRLQWRIQWFWVRVRRWRFKQLSTNQDAFSQARVVQPALILGPGRVELGRVRLGYWPSPGFFGGYVHLEARSNGSRITIADDVTLNNNCVLISDGAGISIGSGTLLGPGVEVYDTDFHSLEPDLRCRGGGGNGGSAAVSIGSNVLLGSGVKVLKGSTIGDNSVVGAGSIVSGVIAPDVIAAGSPCRVLRSAPSAERESAG